MCSDKLYKIHCHTIRIHYNAEILYDRTLRSSKSILFNRFLTNHKYIENFNLRSDAFIFGLTYILLNGNR